MTLKTEGAADGPSTACYKVDGSGEPNPPNPCVTLRGDWALGDDLNPPSLLLMGREDKQVVAGVIVTNLIIDGNQNGRNPGLIGYLCTQPATGRPVAVNVEVRKCDSCVFSSSASLNAPCGSALAWAGAGGYLTFNTVRDAGYWLGYDEKRRCDGITIVDGGYLNAGANTVRDASDIPIVSFTGRYMYLHHNWVIHTDGPHGSAGGIMLGSQPDQYQFDQGFGGGDYRDALVEWNYIDNNYKKVAGAGSSENTGGLIGLGIGSHHWLPTTWNHGGHIGTNTIRRSPIGLNVAGGGSPDGYVTIDWQNIYDLPAQMNRWGPFTQPTMFNREPAVGTVQHSLMIFNGVQQPTSYLLDHPQYRADKPGEAK
jgi:hypothetical protein